jgi:hypothetical protein
MLLTGTSTSFELNDVTLGISDLQSPANNGLSILDPTGSHGVIIAGMFPESVFTHISVVTRGGASRLLIS